MARRVTGERKTEDGEKRNRGERAEAKMLDSEHRRLPWTPEEGPRREKGTTVPAFGDGPGTTLGRHRKKRRASCYPFPGVDYCTPSWPPFLALLLFCPLVAPMADSRHHEVLLSRFHSATLWRRDS